MKKIILGCFICSFILLQNCGNSNVNLLGKENNADTILIQWKADSLGCRGLRTAEKARVLYSQYNLKTKTSNEVTEILGNPNKIIDSETQLSIVYYFDTRCSDGKIIDSIEHCSASFFYIDKKSKDCSLSTSCQ